MGAGQANHTQDRPECTYGDGEKQVALVGNSHAGHWLPTLERLADKNDWTITTFLASNCSISTLPQDLGTPEGIKGCQDYSDWVVDRTTSGGFDAVITSERQSTPLDGMSWEETEKKAPEGHKEILESWVDAKLDVVVIRDTPYPGGDDIQVPDCVAKHEDDLEECSGTPESWYWMDPLAESAKEIDSKHMSIIYPGRMVLSGRSMRTGRSGESSPISILHTSRPHTLRPLHLYSTTELRQTGLVTFD